MTSTHPADGFRPELGDTVYDSRKDRMGVITTRPVPGRWIWLHAPERPLEEWATLFGDLRPAPATPHGTSAGPTASPPSCGTPARLPGPERDDDGAALMICVRCNRGIRPGEPFDSHPHHGATLAGWTNHTHQECPDGRASPPRR